MKLAISLCVLALAGCDADESKKKQTAGQKATPTSAHAKGPARKKTGEEQAKKPDANAAESEPGAGPPAGRGGSETLEGELAGLTPDAAATKLHELAQGTDSLDVLQALPIGEKITVIVDVAACDEKQRKKKKEDKDPCTREDELDKAAFKAWIDENVQEPPGWDAGASESCDERCCSFKDLAAEASKEGVNVPHEFHELTEICFDLDADKTKTINEIRFTLH